MGKKLCVIGLDCVTPQLLYGGWLDEMPTIKRLITEGFKANMVSTIPPITVPAWMAMMTSQDPGQLGIYGFRNRGSYEYEDLYVVNSSNIKAKSVWNHLSRDRKRSLLLGIPLTYPPKPLNGIMVCSFLTPNKDVQFTHPPEYKATLEAAADGDYIIDVKDFRTSEKDRLLEQIYDMSKRRFKAFRNMVTTEDWDFAMMVEMGPDRLHHAFWRYMDKEHRLYEPGNKHENAIKDYYIYQDKEIEDTIASLPEDCSVIVVSDHGAKGMHGGVCINEWLIEEGLLTLVEGAYPKEPARLKPHMIDWSKTKVWGEGGYYARIFMNVEGREPNGIIPEAEYESFRKELKAKIEAIPDENGNPIHTKAFLPEETYRECKGIPPDLVVYLGDLNWRSAGSVGHKAIHIFENDTGPDDANHAQEGIFIWHNRGKDPVEPADAIQIYDIAPSILDYFGLAKPDEMIGKII